MATEHEQPTNEIPTQLFTSAIAATKQRGLIVALDAGEPRYEVFGVTEGKPVKIGRSPACGVPVRDLDVSREHLEATWDGAAWTFRNLGTHGSFLEGERIDGEVRVAEPRYLRLALNTLVVPVPDVDPYYDHGMRVEEGHVIGALTAAVYATIATWAERGYPVLVRGETGTGKTDAARCYARACKRALSKVNTSVANANLGQATLFGAKKGSYSGADSDTEGWFGAARGKVLFLDEIGDVAMDVQAMILHAVEDGEVLTVGAGTSKKIDVRVVAATNKDLEAAVREGRFRADLLGRLQTCSVRLPPLRERVYQPALRARSRPTLAS